MSERVRVELVDDIDHETQATTRVTFAYQGKSYEIDLNDRNLARFDKAMESWIVHARKAGTGRVKRRETASAAEVREWARENGIEVNAKGHIPRSVMEQFQNRRR